MYNANIYINPEILQQRITNMRSEKQKMEDSLNKIKNDFDGITQYWSGDSGDEAYNVLMEYTKDFPKIISEIEKNIQFVENVLATYKQMDQLINEKMEENANIEAI